MLGWPGLGVSSPPMNRTHRHGVGLLLAVALVAGPGWVAAQIDLGGLAKKAAKSAGGAAKDTVVGEVNKKLLLEGETVTFRFFDSRLYEPHAAHGSDLPTAHLLSFKGERGRNPARVFSELITILDLSRRHGDPPVVHLFTHAALYIPRDLVQQVRNMAQIAAVFILPSGGQLNLDYLDLLSAHWVVDHSILSRGAERAEAARNILGATTAKRQEDEEAQSARAGATVTG